MKNILSILTLVVVASSTTFAMTLEEASSCGEPDLSAYANDQPVQIGDRILSAFAAENPELVRTAVISSYATLAEQSDDCDQFLNAVVNYTVETARAAYQAVVELQSEAITIEQAFDLIVEALQDPNVEETTED